MEDKDYMSTLKCWTESPLNRVEPDMRIPEKTHNARKLHMARNSYESYQILLQGGEEFVIREVRFTDFSVSKGLIFSYNFQEEITFEKESFQDPLSNDAAWQVKAGKTQSIWINVYADKELETGNYSGNVIVVTDLGELKTGLEIRVHAAVLPKNSEAAFATEYWMNTVNFWFRYPNSEQLDFLHHYYGCEKYGSAWWDINRDIAKNMKENRVNVLFVRTQDLLLDGGSRLDEEGIYHFHWDLFDRFISFFEEHADIKLFAGYHLIVQTEGKNVYLLDQIDGKMQIGIAPIGSEKAENWMRQFLTALYAHLEELGYQDRWLQHVEDEPAESQSWGYGRKMVKKYMPGIRCMDAIDKQEPTAGMQNHIDLWIPRVDIYEKNREFYDYRMACGDSRWIYNCCEPHTQNYMNKFLGWPLIHHRALPWACFTNHFSGFLHWGYNFWDPDDPWFGLNPAAMLKGDGYIVYPDPARNRVKNSIRMTATRDGAQDFELLKLLADKYPVLAYEKSRKIASGFNHFDWEPENLETARIEILEALDAE